jgi:hypothetical protein
LVVDATAGTSTWVQVGADIDGEAAGDQSGYFVAMSADGKRVIIGAPFNDGTNGFLRTCWVFDLLMHTTACWNIHVEFRSGGDIDGESSY